MNDTNAFLALFSDAAATPDSTFIVTLENQFKTTATSNLSTKRLSSKQKLIIGLTIIATTLLVLALVFLPKRNMADPTKDSLVESVVETTQESIVPFTADPTQNEMTTPNTTQSESSTKKDATNNAPASSNANAQQNVAQTSTPPLVVISGFQASFWNLDLDSAVTPSIPATPANVTTTTSTINFIWGSASPIAGIQSDGFVAQFTKDATDMSGQYKVVYSSDNGLRMHVNEIVVFDYWNNASSSGTAYFTTNPANPTTSITIDYYEYDGPANVSVEITKVN